MDKSEKIEADKRNSQEINGENKKKSVSLRLDWRKVWKRSLVNKGKKIETRPGRKKEKSLRHWFNVFDTW